MLLTVASHPWGRPIGHLSHIHHTWRCKGTGRALYYRSSTSPKMLQSTTAKKTSCTSRTDIRKHVYNVLQLKTVPGHQIIMMFNLPSAQIEVLILQQVVEPDPQPFHGKVVYTLQYWCARTTTTTVTVRKLQWQCNRAASVSGTEVSILCLEKLMLV